MPALELTPNLQFKWKCPSFEQDWIPYSRGWIGAKFIEIGHMVLISIFKYGQCILTLLQLFSFGKSVGSFF